MKITIYLLLILLMCTAVKADDKYDKAVEKLKIATEHKDKEIMVVVFNNLGNCVKCIIAPMNILERSMKKLEDRGQTDRIKIVACVSVNRTKEAKVFKKQYNWKNYICPDRKAKIRRGLGIKASCYLAVVNEEGKIIYKMNNSCKIDDSDIDIFVKAIEDEYKR